MLVSSRIKTIASFIENNDVVVDVGADHGILELCLLAMYPNVQITAVENKKGPYKILESTLKAFKNIRLSLSDGITAVGSNTTTVVIAGMGGLNIRNILDAYPKKVRKLEKIVIDAHRDIDIARQTIIGYGFKFDKEKIIYEEGKFYVISKFLKADEHIGYDADVIQIGYELYKDELWPKYKQHLINKNNKTIEKIKDITSMQDKVLALKKLNERIENYGKDKTI